MMPRRNNEEAAAAAAASLHHRPKPRRPEPEIKYQDEPAVWTA